MRGQISSVHLHKDKKSTRLSRKTESLVLLCFYKKQCRMQKLREAVKLPVGCPENDKAIPAVNELCLKWYSILNNNVILNSNYVNKV